MVVSTGEQSVPVHRDHGFHPLRVRGVHRERGDAVSVVLEIPEPLRASFGYRAGQFVTLRVGIGGRTYLRSYSMSSSPEIDADLAVTVKRVAGGAVSGWIVDTLAAGDDIESTRPAGVFCLAPGDGEIVAFAGGSGITPVFSVLNTALVTTTRPIRLLYANRDPDCVIFRDELDELAARFPDRLRIDYHHDSAGGYLTAEALCRHNGRDADAEYFICGPAPFMDLVERGLQDEGVPQQRVHIERFTPQEQAEAPQPPTGHGSARVTIELDGRVETTDHRPGTTILQTARQVGMTPPFSCEAGDCATCMAKLVSGAAEMRANTALYEDEVRDGWVLTCQAVPTTESVHVVYGYEE